MNGKLAVLKKTSKNGIVAVLTAVVHVIWGTSARFVTQP
jgi:hypothetical protein